MDMAVEVIEQEVGFESVDVIAGGETAGIPFAAWIAERMSLPMIYVRKQPKGFGRMAQIEGDLREGQRVLLVERSEEHTSELQSLMRISYAVFCLKKKKQKIKHEETNRKLHTQENHRNKNKKNNMTQHN